VSTLGATVLTKRTTKLENVSETIHLHPAAPLADRVLLPGDPGRALRLAQQLLEAPKMFNHNRGLWGYTGAAADGELLTVQATGMGGPSAAIVISELHQLGARTMLRVGTTGGLHAALGLGDLVIAEVALAADGTGRSLAGADRVSASPDLLAALRAVTGDRAHSGLVVSTDLFYDPASPEREWAAQGALAIEMEASTLFALAAIHGFSAGAVLIVSDLVLPERRRISAEALEEAEARMGAAAFAALAAFAGDGYAGAGASPSASPSEVGEPPDSSRSSAASIDASR
jgi:DeoD family purine-nucleoside phosphorylase